MNVSKALIRSAIGAALILAVIGGSPLLAAEAAKDVVQQGVDLWMTVAGFAKTSFSQEPIPAGFFCTDSKPDTGTVGFKGSPPGVTPPRGLGSIDTAGRRLPAPGVHHKGGAPSPRHPQAPAAAGRP